MTLKTKLITSGFCTQKAKFAEADAPFSKIIFPTTSAIIEHPKHGPVLFDTGYSPYFYEATKYFPEKIYALLTPVTTSDEETVAAKIKKLNYDPSDIRYIILSHFHADHIGGAKLFPNARFICRKNAYDSLKSRSRLSALASGFLPFLLPNNFEHRVDYIENMTSVATNNVYSVLGQTYDIFKDGSIQLVDLPGHATGQIGALIESDQGPLFLVADACWSERNYKENVLPHPLAHLILQNFNHKDFLASINKLSLLNLSWPELKIVPCHCQKTHEKLRSLHV